MAPARSRGRRAPRLTYGMAAVWSVVDDPAGVCRPRRRRRRARCADAAAAAAAPAHRDVANAHAARRAAADARRPRSTCRCPRWRVPPAPRRPPASSGRSPRCGRCRRCATRPSSCATGRRGEVLLDQRGNELRIPASTTKLLSAAAIGRAFAPDETLRTVVREGDTPDQIVLVAGGDSLLNPGQGRPDASSPAARAWRDLADQVATALKGRGTRRVTLFVDETYAGGPTTAPTWAPTLPQLRHHRRGRDARVCRASGRAAARPGPADPVASVRSAFVRQLETRGIDVVVAARGRAPGVPGSPMPTPTRSGASPATPATARVAGVAHGRRSPGRPGPPATRGRPRGRARSSAASSPPPCASSWPWP